MWGTVVQVWCVVVVLEKAVFRGGNYNGVGKSKLEFGLSVFEDR